MLWINLIMQGILLAYQNLCVWWFCFLFDVSGTKHVKSRPITVDDLEARPGSPSMLVVAESGGSTSSPPPAAKKGMCLAFCSSINFQLKMLKMSVLVIQNVQKVIHHHQLLFIPWNHKKNAFVIISNLSNIEYKHKHQTKNKFEEWK